MKKWLYSSGLILILITPVAAQAESKVAVVNISNIFQQLPQRTIVAKKLENEFRGRAAELQSIERDLQKKIQRLRRDGSIMKASDHTILEKSIIAQREIFSNKAQIFEQDNRRRQTEERNKILEYIQNAVKRIAIKEGFDIVIDTNAIVYVNRNKDITTEVLKQVSK